VVKKKHRKDVLFGLHRNTKRAIQAAESASFFTDKHGSKELLAYITLTQKE
jgi:hypothetical protein